MQTSRNPKVLNNALKYKLQPILDKIAALEDTQNAYNEQVEHQVQQEKDLIDLANGEIDKFTEARNNETSEINSSNSNLTSLINNELFDPNNAGSSDSGSGSDISDIESKLVTDKIVKATGYGFVKDGVDYVMFGLTGKGLAIGKVPGQDLEYKWRNPENDEFPFPSYYISDILMVDSTTAFIATNLGVVIYDVKDDSYIVYDTSCGLPSKEVNRIIKVSDKSGSITGYLAGTAEGIAFSPTGTRWTIIDTSFKENVTTLSKIDLIDTPQDFVFIGTAAGIYYLDIDKVLVNSERNVKFLEGSTGIMPNIYAYGISRSTVNGKMAIATTGGVVVVNDIMNKLSRQLVSDDTQVFTNRNGLVGSAAYDVMWTHDGKLVCCTSNGLAITTDLTTFTSITRTKNTHTNKGKTLNSHICNRIVRMSTTEYTILHGVGVTEGVEI